MTATFEYDVAFSFLAKDEHLAIALSDLLSDRYGTFVYSKHQEKLVGTDGQEAFGQVFGETARTVVVLYRDGWGSTPWTRTEETLIKNRTMRDGWDFLLVIRIAPATLPKWLPHSYIWHDFERFGPNGAASVISALIQRTGGEPGVESLEKKAERVRRMVDFEASRRKFLNSTEAVSAAREAVQEIMRLIEAKCDQLSGSFSFQPKRSPSPNEIAVLGQGSAGMLQWCGKYSNTLDHAYLEMSYWRGHPPLWGVHYIEREPPKLKAMRFTFDITPAGSCFWKPEKALDMRSLTNEMVVDDFFMDLLEQEHTAATRRR
jgi:hypothetical protein